MDESGFAIGEKEAGVLSMLISVNNSKQSLGVRSGLQWCNAFAPMEALFLLVIFKAERLSTQWIPASIHGSWRFNYNLKGWTSNDLGLEWLVRCFDPETRDKAAGEYRLLICDGHDSHITAEFIAH
jgi:hypothetical protein